jgi:hypothetical protein
MGRDDTPKAPELAAIISRYQIKPSMPELTAVESSLINKLREVTKLNDAQVPTAILAAGRLDPEGYRQYSDYWKVLGHAPELSVMRYSDSFRVVTLRVADRLSPLSSYMAYSLRQTYGIDNIAQLCDRLRRDISANPDWPTTYGLIWNSQLIVLSSDESMMTRAGNCVTTSLNISSVLDLAGVESYFVTAYLKNWKLGHDWVVVPDGDVVITGAGVMPVKGRTIVDEDGAPYDRLTRVGISLEWASLMSNSCTGDLAPDKANSIINYLVTHNDGPIFGTSLYIPKDVAKALSSYLDTNFGIVMHSTADVISILDVFNTIHVFKSDFKLADLKTKDSVRLNDMEIEKLIDYLHAIAKKWTNNVVIN